MNNELPKEGRLIAGLYCQDIAEMVSAYYDGEIDGDLRAQIEAHVSECDNCTVVLNTFNKTIELYRDMEKESSLPEDAKKRLRGVLNIKEIIDKEGKG